MTEGEPLVDISSPEAVIHWRGEAWMREFQGLAPARIRRHVRMREI